jgi:ABC transporter with metal-binding/Fe-S-binding domain ATP-binding protein
MRVVVLYSGGKDSNLALWYAAQKGWNIICLLAVHPKKTDSYMFHRPNIQWAKLQAEAMRYPLETITVSGVKEVEVHELEQRLDKLKKQLTIDGVVSGAIQSEYQKSRIDHICKNLGIQSLAPLWMKDPETLLREVVKLGFKIIIISCSAQGLDETWLGRLLDEQAIDEIMELSTKFGINPTFEGGEAETFVIDSPLFNQKIKILSAEKRWYPIETGTYRIKKAVLEPKLSHQAN